MKVDRPVLRGHVPFAWLSCPFCTHGQPQETHQAPKRGEPGPEHQRHRRAVVTGKGKAQGRERGAAISKSLAPSSRPLWFAGLEGVENLGADGPRPGAPGTLRCRRSRSQRFNEQRLGI
jgi:hypothetical protein